jgi:hypothetical protein
LISVLVAPIPADGVTIRSIMSRTTMAMPELA